MAPPHWYVYVEIRRLPVSLASDLCGEPRNCVGNSFADFRKILDGAWSLRLRQYQLRLHAIRFDGGDLTRENDEPAKEHHAGQRLHIRQRVMPAQPLESGISPIAIARSETTYTTFESCGASQGRAIISTLIRHGRPRANTLCKIGCGV